MSYSIVIIRVVVVTDVTLMILRSIPARSSYLQRVCQNVTSPKMRRLPHASFMVVVALGVLMILAAIATVLIATPASFTVVRITTTANTIIFLWHPTNLIDGYVELLLSTPIWDQFILILSSQVARLVLMVQFSIEQQLMANSASNLHSTDNLQLASMPFQDLLSILHYLGFQLVLLMIMLLVLLQLMILVGCCG